MRIAGFFWLAILFCPVPLAALGQQPQTSSLDDTIAAGDDEAGEPARRLVSWNNYEGKYFTFQFGGGFLYDYAAYAQDDVSKSQIELHPMPKLRDTRALFRGRIKSDRAVTWSMGIMWDVPKKKFVFRQTQVMIGVPEISSHFSIGRTKEGVSLNKVMIGYAGWTMERATISDASIPILADGIKWLGYIPGKNILWNLGFYWDVLSEGQTFSTYDHQTAARIAWVPLMSSAEDEVLHLGLNLRYGKVNEGKLQPRSRPEAFPAPYFVDTGQFPAKSTRLAGVEAYYRPGPLLAGSEYYVLEANSPETGNPVFHGGDAFVSWVPTGETRVYNTRGGYFDQISPAQTVFEGGPGAWEFVARFSYIDLDSGPLRGGKFWRFTPMMNWHVSDNIRLEFAYGNGSLDRFDSVGRTQFFQTRVQLQF
jgi:phosphate-selective porin OprO/OprP